MKTKGEYSAPLDVEVPVLTIPQKVFAITPKSEITDFRFIDETKGQFVPFIAEVCMFTNITNRENAEIQTLAEIIRAESSDSDCLAEFPSLGKPNTPFKVHSD